MLRDVRTTCLLDWIFETRWFQLRSVLRRFTGADRRDSFHLVSRVDDVERANLVDSFLEGRESLH